jgi:hypothetical protein
MIIQTIQNSFLLTINQKEFLIKIIDSKSDIYIKNLLGILQNEKLFMISLLREYKNKNVDVLIIKGELISENIKKIKELELGENEVYDLEKELENVF